MLIVRVSKDVFMFLVIICHLVRKWRNSKLIVSEDLFFNLQQIFRTKSCDILQSPWYILPSPGGVHFAIPGGGYILQSRDPGILRKVKFFLGKSRDNEKF